MKTNVFRMLRSGVSLLLAFCMVVGMCPVQAFATENTEEPLVYVSIGDSMTNGYGLDGYDGESGIMNYGVNTYANKFAAWLSGDPDQIIEDDQFIFTGPNGTVDHRQLAMSGMRSEDLHWLLELDYESDAPYNAVYSYIHGEDPSWGNKHADINDKPVYKKWFEWYTPKAEGGFGFTAGDYRTYADLVDPSYRLGDGVAKLMSLYGYNSDEYFNSDYDTEAMVNAAVTGLAKDKYYPEEDTDKNGVVMGYSESEKTARWMQIAGEFYQESVADADVITLALGNTNFGTFLFQYIRWSIENDAYEFDNRYNIEDAYKLLAEFKPELEAPIREMMDNEINDVINQFFSVEAVGERCATEINYIIKYCVLSYLVNYIGSVERIVELNPDVTLIQLALMNAYATAEPGQEIEGTNFADLIDMIYDPVNAFIAALPTYMQATGNELYKDVTFLFADAGLVETLSETFGDNFYQKNGSLIDYPGLELTDDIKPADSLIRARFRHWIAGDYGEEKSKVYYSSKPSYGEIWKGLLHTYVDTSKEGDFFGTYDLMYVTDGDLKNYVNMSNADFKAKLVGDNKTERDWAFSILMYLAFEDALIKAGQGSLAVESLGKLAGVGIEQFKDAIDTFCEKFGVSSMTSAPEGGFASADDIMKFPQYLSETLQSDPTAASLLALCSRMQVGTGIGGHPSEGGHDTMYEAIKSTYETGYTSKDATLDMLKNFLYQQYPNLAEIIYAEHEIGEMDDLAIIITMLKMKQADVPALADVDLDALEAEIRALEVKFQEETTPEEKNAAMEMANDLLAILQEVAAKATYHKYEVTEDSFYVSLGDSNVNGYGLDGYVDGMQNGLGQIIDGAAPVQLAKKLYGDDWKNHFGQYAQGALRSEDMLLLLGDEEGIVKDAYYETEIKPNLMKGNLEDTQKAYIEAIEKADLISIAVGGGNVTTFVGRQVDLVLDGKEVVEMDWKKLGIESETMTELDELLDLMVPLMDQMGMLDQYLPEGMENVQNPAAFARVLAESLLYGYASYNFYYTRVLDRIREINPDAQLLILGMFNPVDDWNLTTEIDGEETFVNIGGIISNIMASANIQNLAYAAQSENTTYVDISDAKTFLDAKIEAGMNPTFADYYKEILEGNGKEVHANAEGHTYIFEQMYASLLEDYNAPYEAMYALYDYLRTYLIENGPEKVLGDAYEFLERNGYIDDLNEALDDLMAQVKKELNDYINGADPELRGALTLLQEEAETLNAQLLVLKSELDAKVTELETLMAAAAGEAGEDILAAIESTKATIATIEKAIAETEAALAEVNTAINACVETLDDLEEAIRYLDNRVVELDAKIAELNNVLVSGSNESIEAVMETVEATKEAIESTIKLVQTAVKSAAELAETVADLSVKAAAAMYAAAENALTVLEGLSDEMKDYTEGFVDEEIEKIKAKYAEEIALLENNKELILGAGALAAQVIYDRENEPDGAITLLKAEIEKAKETGAENLAQLEQDLVDLEAKVEEDAQNAYDAAVIEAEKLYGMTVSYIDETLPKLEAELNAAIAKAEAAYTELKPYIDAAIPVIENVLANSESILAAVEAAVPMAMQAVEDAVNYVIDCWNQAYKNATTRAYLLNSDSYYVALGDSSAYGEKTYVDELAAELELANYKNLSAADNNVLAQMQALATDKALQAEIAKADLITVGFSQVPFIDSTVDTLIDAFAGNAKNPDWAQFVGEENVRYINAIRDELVEGFTTYMDEPMDEKTAALVTAAIEAYAYGVVGYAVVIPEMVNAIHAINPYAVVALVGLYNPMDGVSIDLGTGDALALGDYIDYMVTAAQVHGTAYSMITGNSIYVNAPAVETINTDTDMNIADLLNLYAADCATLNPNAKGHDYIQKCIYEALFTSNPAVMRVFGEDRYETALAAADAMLSVTGAGKFDTVVVATGRDFADALAGSYLAAEMEAPILLVKDSKADLVAGYIAKNLNTNGTIYVLGGEAAVSAATFAKLEKVGTALRLEGENRYETNLAILNEAGTNGGELLIATGKNYADALAASSTGLPVMLVSSSLKAEQKDYLAAAGFSKLTVLGGVNAVSEELAAELAAYGNVDRIAGETRYETSAAIANHYFGGRNGSVVVASGRNFPDALCGGALAAAAGVPVVLTKHGGIEAADDYAVKAALGIVLGGEATGITKQDIVDIFELLSVDAIEYVQY